MAIILSYLMSFLGFSSSQEAIGYWNSLNSVQKDEIRVEALPGNAGTNSNAGGNGGESDGTTNPGNYIDAILL